MKLFLSLLVLANLTIQCAHAALTNVVFNWDAPVGQNPAAPTGYLFYEKIGPGIRTLLGGTTGATNRAFTVSNYVAGTSRTFVTTETNVWGESAECVPYVAPTAPSPPLNLHPVSFNFTAPVPGVIELSQDLENWSDRLRITQAGSTFAMVELVQAPAYPILFGRIKSGPSFTIPPIP